MPKQEDVEQDISQFPCHYSPPLMQHRARSSDGRVFQRAKPHKPPLNKLERGLSPGEKSHEDI